MVNKKKKHTSHGDDFTFGFICKNQCVTLPGLSPLILSPGAVQFEEPDLSNLPATRPLSPEPNDKRDSFSEKKTTGKGDDSLSLDL